MLILILLLILILMLIFDIVIVKIICIYIIDYRILFLKTTCRNSYTAPFSNDSAELLCITKSLVTKKSPRKTFKC